MSPSQPQVATLLLSMGFHSQPMHTASCALMVRTIFCGAPHSQKKHRPSESPDSTNLRSQGPAASGDQWESNALINKWVPPGRKMH
jgi:hypothetical protein